MTCVDYVIIGHLIMVLIELGAVILGVTNKLGGLHRGSPISLNNSILCAELDNRCSVTT